MGTRIVKLQGIFYWAKVFESNRDLTGFEGALTDIGGQTTIDVDLDADNYALLQKSKSMKKGTPSPDNPGHTRVKFTRKWSENYGGGAPDVTKADGLPWVFDEDGPIGNGSEGIVTLAVYDTSRKSIVGTRLDKVKVLVHKEYIPVDDDTPGIREYTKKADTPDTPPAATKPAAKAPTRTQTLVDDEIPF